MSLGEDRPFFSIITVSFNNGNTIENTIQSVLNQTFTDFEYWVVDGKSKDQTLDILHRYVDKLKFISEPDGGIYDAMNKGINLAKGKLIAFLNADDFYADEQVLKAVFTTLKKHPEAWASYGDLAYVDAQNPQKVVRYWRSGTYKLSSFLWGWMPPHPTFFLKKEAFEKFGPFKKEGLKSAADYELMLRMLYKNKLPAAYCQKLLVRMRVGGTSNQTFKNRVRGNQEDRKAWELNQIRPYWFTLFLKPLRKLVQYLQRP
jgi:glycosyltransferase